MIANNPDFGEFLRTSEERGLAYRCIVDKQTLQDVDGLAAPMSKTFTITPVVHGGGPAVAILAGAALWTAGHVFAFSALSMLTTLGAALALGGVAQLLAGAPRQAASGTQQQSEYFDGPVNSTAQGDCVPFGYGKMIVGSKVISAGISVQDMNVSLATNPRIGGFNAAA